MPKGPFPEYRYARKKAQMTSTGKVGSKEGPGTVSVSKYASLERSQLLPQGDCSPARPDAEVITLLHSTHKPADEGRLAVTWY